MRDGKTKKCDGVQLSANRYAYVGDESDVHTWRFPICFMGDEKKTISHIKNALARFPETKGIPENEREVVWLILKGAAISHGIWKFDAPTEFSLPLIEPPAPLIPEPPTEPEPPSEAQLMLRYQQEKEAAATEDMRATQFAERMLSKLCLE